jgi:hypothetical protein
MWNIHSSVNLFVALLILFLIGGVGLCSELGYVCPPYTGNVATFVALLALLIAYYRSGIDGYALWITAIVAYPVIAPYIVRDLLGYQFYSGRAPGFQEWRVEGEPLLIAALASVFFAISISGRKIDFVKYLVPHRDASENNRFVWLLFSLAAMVFFAWLTEPGPPIGLTGYEEMMSYRIPGTDFAGAAWAVFAVASLGCYLVISARSNQKARKVAGWMYWGCVLFSIAYLLAHSRRSEVSGYLILLLCVFGPKLSRWRMIAAGVTMISLLSIIGYIRDPEVPVDSGIQKYAHLPGAPGNILIGYVVAYDLAKNNRISVVPGETYLGHIERIPPAALGFARPLTVYDRVAEKEMLSGGEYCLIEPYVNFGLPGVVAYLVLVVALFNWAVGGIARFARNGGSIVNFIVVGTFTTMMFRMLWYGIGGSIKAMIIAGMVSIIITIVVYSIKLAPKYRFTPLAGG